MKQVTLFQAVVKQYNAPFFDKLHAALRENEIELRVVYSAPDSVETRRSDCVDLPTEYGQRVPAVWLFDRRFILQHALKHIVNADLVILDQGNKYLWNHPLLLASRFGWKKTAFWGHGANLQQTRPTLSEWYKKKTLRSVDWWFAYTASTARYLMKHGVPADRITNVQNAVDTVSLREAVARTSLDDRHRFRDRLGIPEAAPVAAYCGMLEANKLGSVFAVLPHIKKGLPNFHYIVAGAGNAEQQVRNFASGNSWVHWVGPRFGVEKAAFLKAADVLLMPGPLGLVILDAFAMGVPVFTIDIPSHGPEIEYLENGVNGLAAKDDILECSRAFVETLRNTDRMQQLKEGAWRSGSKYTLEGMVERFRAGIIHCLNRRQNHAIHIPVLPTDF